MILHECGFQNHAPQRGREALFTKSKQKMEEEGVESKKKTKKTTDGIRNSQTSMCVACSRFCRRSSRGEKCTGVEPQAVFEGGMERTKSEPNEQQSDKSEQK